MNIIVHGDCKSARAVRGRLRMDRSVALLDSKPLLRRTPCFEIIIEESREYQIVVLDSVNGPLEGNILNRLQEHTRKMIGILRASGQIHMDQAIRIIVPESDRIEEEAAENAIVTGVLQSIGAREEKKK